MITIDPETQTERENYKLLIGSIVPRPIALITSLSAEGVLNVAPFSYFSIVSSHPPLLSVSIQRRAGVMKDSARNAMDSGEFVVHIVDTANVQQANQAARSLPPHESEIMVTGFTPLASEVVSVPGLHEAKIRMECKLERAVPLGGDLQQPACDLLIGRVVRFHIAEEVYDNGYILIDQLKPVSRLAGQQYATVGERFTLERPQ